MSATDAATVRAFYEDLWEKGDLSRLPALMTEDVAFRGTFGQVMRGHDAYAAYVRSVRDAFGTYRCEIRDLVAGEGKVAARIGFSGVHDAGPFLDVPPTGKTLAWEGVGFFTMRDGRIADLWVMRDMRGLLAQLHG